MPRHLFMFIAIPNTSQFGTNTCQKWNNRFYAV
jgi:hypothetical protein